MKSLYLFSVLAVSLVLQACGPSPIYKENHTFSQDVWTYADSLVFEPEIRDTQARYDLYLQLEHGENYPFSNIYCQLSVYFPEIEPRIEQVSLELADAAGNWLGNCGSGQCTRSLLFAEGVKFASAGKYRLVFQQYSRQDSLPGVKSVNFQIFEQKEKS